MHRCVHLTLLLAAALALLAVPIASGASPDLVVSQVYAGGGNSGATYANDFVELFNRGSSTVDLTGLVAAVRDRLRHELAGDRARRTARARSPLPRRARLGRRERRGTSHGRRDGHVESRGFRWQGRARGRRRRALVRSDGRKLQHRRGRPRPRRLRLGDRLRGRRRTRALEHCSSSPWVERLRRHRCERHGLHNQHSGSPNKLVRVDGLHRHAASGRLRIGSDERRAGSAVDALDRTREADAQLRQRLTRRLALTSLGPHHRHEHGRCRLHPQRPPERVCAGRSPTWALRHGPCHRTAWSGAGRRRARRAAGRTSGRPARRHARRRRALRPATTGRQPSHSPLRSPRLHRGTTRRPSPSR